MAKELQLRLGNAGECDLFLGVEGEPIYDTTNHHLRICDGATLGGWVVALMADLPTKVSQLENDVGFVTETTAASKDWVNAYTTALLTQYYTKIEMDATEAAIRTDMETADDAIRTDMEAADEALEESKIAKSDITDDYLADDPDPVTGNKKVMSAAGTKAIVDDLIAAIDAAD